MYRLTPEDKTIIIEMYKAHYTAKEIAKRFPYGYTTVVNLFKVYKQLDIKKYSRITLLEAANDVAINE